MLLFNQALGHFSELNLKKISNRQQCARFRKLEKVLYQSTLVYLQHYYTVSVIRGEAQAPVLLLIQLINTHTHKQQSQPAFINTHPKVIQSSAFPQCRSEKIILYFSLHIKNLFKKFNEIFELKFCLSLQELNLIYSAYQEN